MSKQRDGQHYLVDSDTTAIANSNLRLMTQKAILAYIAAYVATHAGVWGTIDGNINDQADLFATFLALTGGTLTGSLNMQDASININNGIVQIDRPSTSDPAWVKYRTNGATKWYMGMSEAWGDDRYVVTSQGGGDAFWITYADQVMHFVNGLDMEANQVNNMADGTLDTDGATVGQLNTAIAGVSPVLTIDQHTSDFSIYEAVMGHLKEVDCSGGNIDCAFDDLANVTEGKTVQITKTDATANMITFTPYSGQTVNGVTDFTLSVKDACITLVADVTNSNWRII